MLINYPEAMCGFSEFKFRLMFHLRHCCTVHNNSFVFDYVKTQFDSNMHLEGLE